MLTCKDLARINGCSPHTIYRRLRKLREAGLLLRDNFRGYFNETEIETIKTNLNLKT